MITHRFLDESWRPMPDDAFIALKGNLGNVIPRMTDGTHFYGTFADGRDFIGHCTNLTKPEKERIVRQPKPARAKQPETLVTVNTLL